MTGIIFYSSESLKSLKKQDRTKSRALLHKIPRRHTQVPYSSQTRSAIMSFKKEHQLQPYTG